MWIVVSLSSTKRRVIVRSGCKFTSPVLFYEELKSVGRTTSQQRYASKVRLLMYISVQLWFKVARRMSLQMHLCTCQVCRPIDVAIKRPQLSLFCSHNYLTSFVIAYICLWCFDTFVSQEGHLRCTEFQPFDTSWHNKLSWRAEGFYEVESLSHSLRWDSWVINSLDNVGILLPHVRNLACIISHLTLICVLLLSVDAYWLYQCHHCHFTNLQKLHSFQLLFAFIFTGLFLRATAGLGKCLKRKPLAAVGVTLLLHAGCPPSNIPTVLKHWRNLVIPAVSRKSLQQFVQFIVLVDVAV